MGTHLAIIERELRRFRRSPMLIVDVDGVADRAAGRAGLRVRRQRQAPDGWRSSIRTTACPALRVRELALAVAAGARTFDTVDYADDGQAMADLRNGRVNGVLTIPPDFSRRVLARNAPRVALIEDNTDNFVSVALAGTLGG